MTTFAYRILALVNGSFFLLLLGWMVSTYFSAPAAKSVIHVPETFEMSRIAPAEASEPSEWDAIAGVALSAEGSSDDHPLQQRGKQAFADGRVGEAIGLLRAAARERPRDASIWNDLGVYLSREGRHEEALPVFARAVEVDPQEARGHFNLGTAELRAGREEAAIPALGRALELSPYYGEARYNLAQAWTRVGNVDAARDAYREITLSDRGRTGAAAHNNLGILLRRDGKPREALDHFNAALRAFPSLRKARFNKALVLTQLGMQREARVQYEKLLDVAEGHAAARTNLAVLLMRDRDWAEAVDHLSRVVRDDPSRARAQYNLGLCQARLGDDGRAIKALDAALASDPEYAEAAYNLGLALRRQQDVEGAALSFARAAALRPDQPEYHYNLGLALAAKSGESSAVSAAYERALALRPDYFRARYNLGLVMYREGRFAEARDSFGQALALRADSYEAAYNLGLALLKLDDPGAAESALRRATALEDRVEAHYNLGLALFRLGRRAEAADTYREGLRIDPKHARSIERLAEAHIAEARHGEAQRLLERLQLLDPEDPSAYNAGLRAYRAEQYDVALRYLEISAVGASGLRARSLNMAGLSQSRLGRSEEAVRVLERAVAEFPGNERLQRNLAIVRARSGL